MSDVYERLREATHGGVLREWSGEVYTSLCCDVCGDSRESMDPMDQYPDMGYWRRGAWICDVCADDDMRIDPIYKGG